MRGRLINPFLAKIEQLDTDATMLDPDGAGELTSGYDPEFREPRRNADGTLTTKYKTAIFVPCQFEPDDEFEQLGEAAQGNDTNSRVRCVFHFQDLEEAGLVDATTGDALLRLNDRLLSIHRYSDQALIQRAGLGDGFYCTEAKPASFGLSGGERNLLVCTYSTRDSSFKG